MFANTSKGTKQERDALGSYQCRERAVTLATDVRWEDIAVYAQCHAIGIRILNTTHSVTRWEFCLTKPLHLYADINVITFTNTRQ